MFFKPDLLYIYPRTFLLMTILMSIAFIFHRVNYFNIRNFFEYCSNKIDQELAIGKVYPIKYQKGPDELEDFIELLNNLIIYLNKKIETAQKFNANVSHELKSPLTALKADLEYFLYYKTLDNDASCKIKGFIEKIDNLERITSQLLFISNNNVEILSKSMKRIFINEILYEILDEKSALIKEKELKVITKIPKAVSIHAHRQLLKHAIANIMDNAIKYSLNKKNICIVLKEKKNFIYLVIKDEGVGISRRDIKFIFHPYYRGRDISSKITGYGLGLSLAAWILELHNASIKVHSIPNKKTTMLVKFELY